MWRKGLATKLEEADLLVGCNLGVVNERIAAIYRISCTWIQLGSSLR